MYLKWTGANSAIPCRTLALEQFDPKLLRFQPLLSATMVLDRHAEAQQLQRVSSLIASVFAKETEQKGGDMTEHDDVESGIGTSALDHHSVSQRQK